MDSLDLGIKTPAPEVTEDEIALVCDYLAKEKRWVTSAEIEHMLGIKDRHLRAIAEYSDGRILSGPGCPGYKLFTGATEIQDADACAGRLESQAKKMLHRAAKIRRRYHRFAHA